MSEDAPAPDGIGADGIEAGRRLIRVVAPGHSLADRLAERFGRLAWRTPLHQLKLKGRHPLKLIAAPHDPVPGDAARGHALLDGRIAFRGESHALAELDFAARDWGKPFAAYVHSFAWLRDLSTVATRAAGAPIAEALTARWLAAYGETIDRRAWAPEQWGRRMLFWTSHAPLLLSSADLIYRSAVLNAIARGARHLDRNADGAAPGAGRIAAWSGVVAAGLLIPGGEGRRGFGEAGLARALAGGIGADGGIVTRVPAELLEAVTLLAMLRETYAATGLAAPDMIGEALARATAALLGVALGDRGLGSWQGGGPVEADALAAAIDAGGVRTRPLREAAGWGYQRLAAGGAVVVMDAAPPPVGQAPSLVMGAAGCASTLAFEFSDGADRLVVNCGGAQAATARLPRALAQGLRSTAAHSTLVLADTNSTALHADGGLGRGVTEVELTRHESEGASRIDAAHDGYRRRFGFRHRRQLVLTQGGRELRGEDALLPAGRRKGGATAFAVRFHLGAGVEASPTADGQAAVLRLPGAALWQFRCRGGTLAIEPSLWIDAAGRPVTTQQLVVTGDAAAGGASIGWVFKRVR